MTIKRRKYDPISLDENVDRPSWTSESGTGMWDAHKYRHGRDLEKNFYIISEGCYRKRK